MKITDDVLRQLGSEAVDAEQKLWVLKERGYLFYFEPNDDRKSAWWFWTEADGVKHLVTDLEECFGIVAEDYSKAGTDQLKKEFASLMGLRQ